MIDSSKWNDAFETPKAEVQHAIVNRGIRSKRLQHIKKKGELSIYTPDQS